MYLVSRKHPSPEDTADYRREFVVLGSIGNLYTVTISRQPDCTCPDFHKGNLCKHILFIFLKVLRVARNSPLIHQAALVARELDEIFQNAPKDPTAAVVANQQVRNKYTQMSGIKCDGVDESLEQTESKDQGDPGGIKQRPVEGECPICYEEMKATDSLVWCKGSCGNSLHKDCFNQWATTSKGSPTCVYCRAHWVSETNSLPSMTNRSDMGGEGYVNLGNLQGMSTSRPYEGYGYGYW